MGVGVSIVASRAQGSPMTTTVEPITAEELVGYVCAMATDQPWGDPGMAVEDHANTSP